MAVFSSSPFTFLTAVSRVSSPASSLSLCSIPSPSSVLAPRSSVRRRRCACVLYSSSANGMAELVKNKASSEASVASSSAEEEEKRKVVRHSRTFLDARSGEELLFGIKTDTEAGRLPLTVASGLEELYQNYKSAVFQSGIPNAEEVMMSNMALAFDRIILDVQDPFDFPPHHKAIREPFDYYMFAQNFIRALVDFRSSFVGNIPIFQEMEEKLNKGHNVILMSNHQSEADPAVIALMLEITNPHIAENLTYIAGDRVVTDPLCKPFSMGRNLICVYSKKHMNDIPELAEKKRRANTRSLKEMALLLRGGSQLIWIAPSGGRDRPDPHTEEWYPAPFDSSAVDNMRRLTEHADVPGHIYPLSVLCHDIMPPPPRVEKEIGEKRLISYHGVGVSVAPEISFLEIAASCEKPEEAKEAYSKAMYDAVSEQYNVLNSAIHGKKGNGSINSKGIFVTTVELDGLLYHFHVGCSDKSGCHFNFNNYSATQLETC